MKKSLRVLVLSALTCNLLVSHLSMTVQAEESNGDIPVESALPETEPIEAGEEGTANEGEAEPPSESEADNNEGSSSEDLANESDSSEIGSIPESSISSQTEVDSGNTSPDYQPDSYIVPREQPRTAITSSEVADEFYITANLENLTNLLASSLDDENFLTAWQDYQLIIQSYQFKDKEKAESSASTLSEILNNFQGSVAAEEVKTEEGLTTLVFTYSAEALGEEDRPAQMILYGDDDNNLVGAALLQASTTQDDRTPLAVDLIQGLFLEANRRLYAEKPFVKAFYQELSNDVIYTTVALPSEDEQSVELVVIDNQFVLNHVTTEITETPLAFKLQELTQIFINSLSEETSSEEESDSSETSKADESTAEETSFVSIYAPTGYDEEKVTAYDQLLTAYQSLLELVENDRLSITDEQLVSLFGEPASKTEGGSSTYYSYYSIEDDHIVLLDIQLDSQTDAVKTILYDDRTPALDEAFSITVDDLFALAEEDLSMANLKDSLGEPNLVEDLFVGGYQRRNVWTSYADPEMRNIEAYEEVNSGNIELFYYDQD